MTEEKRKEKEGKGKKEGQKRSEGERKKRDEKRMWMCVCSGREGGSGRGSQGHITQVPTHNETIVNAPVQNCDKVTFRQS